MYLQEIKTCFNGVRFGKLIKCLLRHRRPPLDNNPPFKDPFHESLKIVFHLYDVSLARLLLFSYAQD